MDRIRLFLDTEFTGLHQSAHLISLALVSETGDAFYAELTDYDSSQLSDWHNQHIVPNLFLSASRPDSPLPDTHFVLNTKETVGTELTAWLSSLGQVEIWADVLAWDWVLFCELFGGAFGLPENVFYIPFDLATLFYLTGNPDVSRETFAFPDEATRQTAMANWPSNHPPKHNALWDAQVSRHCFERLKTVVHQLS